MDAVLLPREHGRLEPDTIVDFGEIYKLSCGGGPCDEDNVAHTATWSSLQAAALSYYGGNQLDPKSLKFKNTGDDVGVDDDQF